VRIELDNVSKRYGRQVVLDRIDLEIPERSQVALVGPNGSGKSTLLRIVMGLLRSEGRVLVGGEPPFERRDRIASKLAYVPQVAPQLGAPVRDVVRAIAELRGLDLAAVGAVAERLELPLAPIAKKPFRALSGGMKQKLLLALAFASDASLFILDEPTASLDESARKRFVELLGERAEQATVIVCSHRLEDVQRFATRVVALADGRIARDFAAVDGQRPPRLARTGGPR
jgi:ABC-2 type transport system ATP-binding protein